MTGEPRTAGDVFEVAALADHGLLFTLGEAIDAGLSGRIAALADALEAASLPGVVDLIPSYTTLVVILDPGLAAPSRIVAAVRHEWARIMAAPVDSGAGREVTIPVRYGNDDGPDLLDVARATGLDPQEVIRRHAGAAYQVGAIGFAPGFAFLIGLPPDLAVARRATPRTAVPPGSVGIGGRQTGIYSLETPGGWSLIGRTPLRMFDPDREPPSLLQAGDTVRFESMTASDAGPHQPVPARRTARSSRPHRLDAFEVIAPGLQDSVQDLGRPGRGRLGVTPGGAADRSALALGNRLVGNPEGAAGLEITLAGGRYLFLRPGRIVLAGADLGASLNGLRLPVGRRRVVRPGDELSFRLVSSKGMRAYLCLAGGIDVPLQLGSRATDLTAGFGGIDGRPLRAGDRLRVADERTGIAPVEQTRVPGSGASGPIRVVRGPQSGRFDGDAYATLFSREFTVSPQSNRLGLRLEGPMISPANGADITSEGLVTGTIQVTGQGQPIVMLPARATIGGYAKIATVIAADLDRLGQLRPGQRIRFVDVTVANDDRW